MNLVTMRCNGCMVAKRGCLFKDLDWGVAKWPMLKVTEAGEE